jgi:hypothetical protein
LCRKDVFAYKEQYPGASQQNFANYFFLLPYEHDRCSSAKFNGHVSHPCFIYFATRCLLAVLTDVSGGRIRMTRNRLIMGLITPHRAFLTITKTRKGRPRPDPGCSATDDDDDFFLLWSKPISRRCFEDILSEEEKF